MKQLTCFISGLMLVGAIHTQAQQKITVTVDPTVNNAIKGHLELDRKKYINLAGSSSEMKRDLDATTRDKYLLEYEMNLGRSLGVVYTNKNWGNNIREDVKNPGHVDLDYLKQKCNPNDDGMDAIKDALGANQDLAAHDRHNSYPDFMESYSLDEGKTSFPVDNEATAEISANLFKYNFTDFQRPKYFELVNEPHWQFWGDQRFYGHHTAAKRKFVEMGIPTEVGGPCYSVSYYYKNNFKAMDGMTKFIDGTNFELDFYSFHTYDYMRWDDEKQDFIGAVSSGLPGEAVFDALAAYTSNRYGKEFSFVGSEHGGYNSNTENRVAAAEYLSQKYFPAEAGFDFEMEKRSIDNFLMVNSCIANTLTFMNNPHIVKKAVPFILLQSANWDPYYYSSLLVKENFDKTSANFRECQLIHFYDFFKDVRGRRVKTICKDADIQHFSFVEGNTLAMVFHNQANEEGEMTLNINEEQLNRRSIKVRRVGRENDFRPYLNEEEVTSLDQLSIAGQESVVVFIEYSNDIPVKQKLNTIPFYSKEVQQEFTGQKDFTIKVDQPEMIHRAVLRVGIGRQNSSEAAKNVEIYFNGVKLSAPVEDCAERLTSYDSDPSKQNYATTRIVEIPLRFINATNTVKVVFSDGSAGGVGAAVLRASYDLDNTPPPVTGINDKTMGSLKVWPNPSSDRLNFEQTKDGTYEIVDMNGRVILSDGCFKGQNQIDITKLISGNYILKTSEGDLFNRSLFSKK